VTNFTHLGLDAACDDAAMGRVLWSVREGRAGEFGAREIADNFRSASHVEPKLGEVLTLPDGSAWRVVDWAVAGRADEPGNVLVVQPAVG
jgi:hypothetical protein